MSTLTGLREELFSSDDESSTFIADGFQHLHTLLWSMFRFNRGTLQYTGGSGELREFLYALLVTGNILEVNVSEAVRAKYRKVCPRCHECPCECWDMDKTEKPAYEPYLTPLPKERSLAEIQRTLNRVFPKRQTLSDEVLHLAEEIRELDEAYLQHDAAGMGNELADVFAWLARIASTLRVCLDSRP